MALERVSNTVLGYDSEQVDALLDRVRRQYEKPKSRFITPAMLASVEFDLAPGGYRIDQTDAALAEVAIEFEHRELKARLERIGTKRFRAETRSLIGTIVKVLSQDEKKRFSPARNGYHPKRVREILRKLSVQDGLLSAPSPSELKTAPLGRKNGGPARFEVNEFLGIVVSVIQRQELVR